MLTLHPKDSVDSLCRPLVNCLWTGSNRSVSLIWLVMWHSGRTSAYGRRTYHVLRSTCSWWMTIYVGKPSATGQPTRPTQPFILSKSINWVVSCNRMFASSAPSGECLRGEGLVWLIGAVVCVVAAALRSRIIGSCQSTATSCDCTARLVAASPRK